ncbi:MAG: CHAT domain-containing protein [Bacteroidia bacterium]|nr:CHAT domain-containing protein [Bacteroidia bacterium]
MSELSRTFILFYLLFFSSLFIGGIYAQSADTTLARNYQRKGQEFARLANYDSSLFYIEKAHRLFKEAGRTSVYLYLQVYQAEVLNSAGERDKSLQLLLETLKTCEKELPADAYPISEVHNQLSILYYTQGDREKCYFHIEKAYEIEGGKEKPAKPLINILVNKANYDFKYGYFKASIPLYEEALRLYEKLELDDLGMLTRIYGNLGNVYERIGEQKRAEALLLKGLEIKESVLPPGHPSIAISLMNLANTQRGMGDLQKGLETQQRARKIMLDYPKAQQRNLAFLDANMAMSYASLGKFDQAESLAQEAIEIAESLYPSTHPMITQISMRMAHIFGYRSKEKEFEMYQTVLARIDEKTAPFIKIRALENIGTNLYQQKQYTAALKYLDQAEALLYQEKGVEEAGREAFNKIDDKEQLFWILWGKAFSFRALAREGEEKEANLKKAQQYYNQVIEMLNLTYEDLRYEASRKAFLSGYIKEVIEEAIWVEAELHTLNPALGSLEHSFSLAENRKSTYLLESIRNTDPERFAGIPAAILEREKQILSDLEKLGGEIQATLASGDSSKRQNLLAEERQLTGSYDSLVRLIETEYADYYRIKYKQESISLKSLQNNLKEGSLLLEYYEGAEHLFLIAIDKQSFNFYSLERSSETDSLLDVFLTLNSNREKIEALGSGEDAIKSYVSQAKKLYNLLLKEALEGKEYQELIIVPDGKLSYLSFDLLLSEEMEAKNWRDLDYLYHSYRIQYAYSATVRYMRSKSTNRANDLFAGFAPKYGSELFSEARDLKRMYQDRVVGELRFSQDEVASIADYYGGNTFLGNAATEGAFKRRAKDYQVLHLAMHAFVNDEEAMYSGLLFAPPGDQDSLEDGFLHAFEIYNLDLDAELVILSACNTGQGQYQQGEGVVSLARAFAYSGCPNILMSLWQADDAATRQLMQAYHKELAAGKGKVEALQIARDFYLENSDLTHPYYWGAFALIGDDTPLEKGVFPWGWVLLGVVIIGGGLFWRRQKMLA